MLKKATQALINQGFSHFSTIRKRCEYVIIAEQKARITYDNILRLSDDPDVNDVIKFLRQREIVHYQRFGEALRIIMDK